MPARIGSPDVGMFGDLARQRQKRDRFFERQVVGREPLGQRGAFRLLALALLHILAEPTVAQRDLVAGGGVDPERAHAGPFAIRARAVLPVGREHPREAALGIVRAADEGAELAELQRQLPLVAGGAEARVGAVRAGGEDVRPEQLVEAVEHLARAQVLGAAERAGKIDPEVAQQVLPVDLAVGDPVELLLEVGGEVVADIFGEERFEKRCHEPALVLRDQPLLLDAHVIALAQHRERRGIGRGAADAELFHALDERRLGVARRRLGEMLARLDALLGQGFARLHRRQARRILVFLVVAALLVEREEAGEANDLAGRAEIEFSRPRLGEDVDRGALEFGALHLAGDRAVPDQLVELGLFGLEMLGDVLRPARRGRSAGSPRGLPARSWP